ncbi:ZYRO0F09548p [Zygosaccharomyces rouxii]|uniref:Anthranilate phosphoribosyltransferase n=1 Tax=Zygosaccharomyces rouxii (strain ATCC 2623 / CBS 732 / NBRC 1130 / NCYC 568 / NRRL Y-229) TaxID=559307 RepID=C5DY18_ZYGRC|nr:uncharacterized protein ZYRO0F09548g [Zygosaccharomyces rouxii]KAH9199438.1 glycosyl transferase family, a/b domain-containing protein [Zygosaccharomyces rouxii]CAR28679.1 ZYRO0F09548p [Zygosaccharomyces rouxii]
MVDINSLVPYTKKLLAQPPTLSPSDLHAAISIILKLLEELESESKDQGQEVNIYVVIGSFLTALRTTGLDHKAEYIAEAARAVLVYSDKVKLESGKEDGLVLDIVGTGGDGQNTFNVSTSAAIVASGIPGFKVCKHGGKASTSNSGAGDMIAQLGCDVSKVNSRTVPHLWDANDFLFLLAPYFHNGMRLVSKIRKLLGIPTVFNVLGPLIHPVPHVNRRVLGVYSKELAPEYAKAAALVYPNSETFVVWGHVGLDEVSPIGKTTIWHVNGSGKLDVFEIEPSMFGLPEHELSQCQSLGPEANAKLLKEEVLNGKLHCKEGHPVYDYILLNTAVLYCLSKGNKDWREGIAQAEQSIHSGKALQSLQHFINELDEF